MSKIYEPKGAAREYSPLALNYIKGCDHGCKYCYVPNLMKRFDSSYDHSNVMIKNESQIINEIRLSAQKNKNSEKQVFLSFLTDPYSKFNSKIGLTRKVLIILKENNIPVSILSKGGTRCLSDIDIFKSFGENIQVGASLTLINDSDTKKWEKGSSMFEDRFEALKILHKNRIKTWASMEPVIDPDQSLEIMRITNKYVDAYKIGKMNHLKNHEKNIDWTSFLNSSISIMRKFNKNFYIKKDLLEHKSKETILFPHEIDMDYLSLKNTNSKLLFG
jgi:DNA repair photolyase